MLAKMPVATKTSNTTGMMIFHFRFTDARSRPVQTKSLCFLFPFSDEFLRMVPREGHPAPENGPFGHPEDVVRPIVAAVPATDLHRKRQVARVPAIGKQISNCAA